ncbi:MULTISPECIES: hypothetical protein [unclassified Variovorax]|uniref:hypothetical protein n=1 Tax=unclassified Variovorax TaxID=663243 RepID=UPI000B16E33C|nr:MULTISPECIES: hypothetical protein [unclassified Variovorax]PNG46879.1 hypothetical protein CHC06_07222 [Variovorax sp. B2]PNG48470.1 hypothetical protein CHC07_07646 [Variovorax sp. B4]VTV14704.1 hypothetical protein WDL1CHR_05196 [Variovorax sp. WDL1]
MPPRVVALLLAVIFLWSGVAMTEERFALVAGDLSQGHGQAVAESLHTDFSGSLDDHLIDDQPHAEHVLDLAALLNIQHDRGEQMLTAARPRPPADVILRSPYLEGPQRPPCAASVLIV